MTDEKRMLGLLRDLIATNSESPPGGEADVAKVLRDHLESYGISCVAVGPSARPNLIFSTHEGSKGPLVLHGHMDTVPAGPRDSWAHDPFGSEIEGGRLYGRGACDMKGPLAALTETMILYSETKSHVPLLMLATSDEESGCSGAEEVAKSGLLQGVRFGVCAEPTGLDVLVGEKGMLWTRLTARGRAAHGSRPEDGVNAIRLCAEAISALDTDYYYELDDLMGAPTFSVGMIRGGLKINIVPDHCEALLDMRTVRGQDLESVMEEMRTKLEAAGLADRVKVEYMHGKPAVVTPIESEIVTASLESVQRVTGRTPHPRASTFGTDCSVLQPKIGITNVICGPGRIEQAHQPDEFIELSELPLAVDVYLDIARHFNTD
ncbi:MAG: M20 family metallopeptidase [Candidatus Thorarchaeota archaeon]|nr:M20 family metallopeptidase [Candidatus Thorarchaeota archaeon]